MGYYSRGGPVIFRGMRPEDVDACVALIPEAFKANDMVRAALPVLWRQLLRDDALHGGVVVDATLSPSIVAFGLTTFVNDDFVSEYLAAPRPYLSAIVYERALAGRSPILSEQDLRQGNSAGTLNFVILHFGLGLRLSTAAAMAAVGAAEVGFRLRHTGYRVRRVLQEAYGAEEVRMLESAGMQLKSDYAAFYAEHSCEEPPVAEHPYLMGLTADDPQSQRPGTAAAAVFQYAEPRFFFSPAEQRVLALAVLDQSDEEIAAEIGGSRAGIKKIWRRAYQRVADVEPDLLVASDDDDRAIRGKEKRRNLIRYLRYHLEELRPLARRRHSPRRSRART